MPYTNTNGKVATPATATQDFCKELETKIVDHYTPIFTPELLIGNRKACYGTVINSTIAGVSLINTVGTDYSKEMTEAVLNRLTATISTIE